MDEWAFLGVTLIGRRSILAEITKTFSENKNLINTTQNSLRLDSFAQMNINENDNTTNPTPENDSDESSILIEDDPNAPEFEYVIENGAKTLFMGKLHEFNRLLTK